MKPQSIASLAFAFASVSGIHGLFVVGGCVFLFGALTIILRRGQVSDRQPTTGESLETGRPTL
jgi:heme/copper-type cytochrome/quinol oxidase subunit 3